MDEIANQIADSVAVETNNSYILYTGDIAINQIQEVIETVANTEEIVAQEELYPNDLGDSVLSPICSPEELQTVYEELESGEVTIVNDECVDSINNVYHITTNHNGTTWDYWVNSFWHDRLLAACEAGSRTRIESNHQEIPENSATITIDETTSRFSGAIWYEEVQKQTVTLAGIGGIGGYCAFLLGRLKPAKLIIYDPDKVETVNMSGQLYSYNDVGKDKVTAISQMIRNYTGYTNVVALRERFTRESQATGIMICGFDNMTARKDFFIQWYNLVQRLPEEERKKCLLIDGRLAAEEYQVLAIQGDDERAIKKYQEEWLFSDAEAEETICSYKQTTFMANMIASTMVNTFVNFIANQVGGFRDVPFFISYDASTMFTKVEM